MRIVLILMLLVISWSAYADPQPWMKQVVPDIGLYFNIGSDECPFSNADLEARIEGEFLRARLKPSKNPRLSLNVYVICLRLQNINDIHTGYAVHHSIYYGTMSEGNSVLYELSTYSGLSSVGHAGGAGVMQYVQDNVAAALTDYLKENVE